MGEGSEWEAWCIVCVCLSVCVSLCKKRKSFFSWWLFQALFAGLLCVWGLWYEAGHQGKEFNKSCRKRSGSGISERRPERATSCIISLEYASQQEFIVYNHPKLIRCVPILTYNIKDLWQGLSRHEFILEGPEHTFWRLVDWHVVVTDIFCQREGPAPLCVAGGCFL